jgi:hypothetical protein
MYEVLSLSPSTTKGKKKKETTLEGHELHFHSFELFHKYFLSFIHICNSALIVKEMTVIVRREK